MTIDGIFPTGLRRRRLPARAALVHTLGSLGSLTRVQCGLCPFFTRLFNDTDSSTEDGSVL